VAILSIGTRLSESLRAAFIMKDAGDIGVTVADARYMKPLDTDLMSVGPKP
jgi:1-deoxy-D-xylulose-5-phosphate synthase